MDKPAVKGTNYYTEPAIAGGNKFKRVKPMEEIFAMCSTEGCTNNITQARGGPVCSVCLWVFSKTDGTPS